MEQSASELTVAHFGLHVAADQLEAPAEREPLVALLVRPESLDGRDRQHVVRTERHLRTNSDPRRGKRAKGRVCLM